MGHNIVQFLCLHNMIIFKKKKKLSIAFTSWFLHNIYIIHFWRSTVGNSGAIGDTRSPLCCYIQIKYSHNFICTYTHSHAHGVMKDFWQKPTTWREPAILIRSRLSKLFGHVMRSNSPESIVTIGPLKGREAKKDSREKILHSLTS